MEVTSKWHKFLGLPKWSPEIVPARLPKLWTAITFNYRVRPQQGQSQICSPCRDFFNTMLHSQIGCREEIDSRLLVVGSQIGSLTPDPSFAHNLGLQMSKRPMPGHFRHLRFKTFPMTPRTPQCEVSWALLLSPEHSGVPEGSKSPTLEVLGFTPTLGQSGVATIYQKLMQTKMNN